MASRKASNGHARRGAAAPRGRKVQMTPEEREVVARACRYYRSSVPSYLSSRQQEIELLDRILRQLD